MASKSNSRRGSAAPSKTASLAAETADMEAKLMELRKAMEQERAKREKANAEASHWRSGGAGALRSNFRSKPSLPPVQSQESSQPITAAATTATTQQASLHSHQSPGIKTAISSLGSISQYGAMDNATPFAAHRAGQLTPPVHASSSSRAENDNPISANPARLRASPSQEPIQNLAQGEFDEADSHSSFLEALNEWRAGNRGGGGSQAAAARPTSPTTKLLTSQPAPASAAGIQTDIGSNRPASSKPVSYFNRLLMSSASRQAGAAAAHSSTSTADDPPVSDLPAPSANPGALPPRKSITTLPPLSSSSGNGSASQVYAVEAAMTSSAHSMSGVKHKGLDILEELERLEIQHYRAAQQYDSDEEWAALLSPHPPGRPGPGRQEQQQLVVTTQQGGVGLTKGARLPDAILLPEHDVDEEHDNTR